MTILLELKCVGAFRNPMFEGQLFFPLENIKVFLDKICHRLMLQVELNLYSQTQTLVSVSMLSVLILLMILTSENLYLSTDSHAE